MSSGNIIVINFLLDDGGFGDSIARIPVLKYIEKNYPNVIVHAWVPPYFKEFAKRCITNHKQIIIRDFTELNKYKKAQPTYSYAHNHIKNLASHMTDHAFFVMNFQPTSINDKNYPKVKLDDVVLSSDITNVLPKKYAVLSTGYTSPVREWKPEHINKVSDYLNSMGITPVYLGKTESDNKTGHIIKAIFEEEIDFSKGVSLIDQTDLVESAKIIEGAELVIGLDNGLIHVAACTDVKIVVGYTTLFSQHRLPIRDNVLGNNCYPVELTDKELDCRGCQSRECFRFNHDFKQCYKGTMECLKLLDSDKYIFAINKAILF